MHNNVTMHNNILIKINNNFSNKFILALQRPENILFHRFFIEITNTELTNSLDQFQYNMHCSTSFELLLWHLDIVNTVWWNRMRFCAAITAFVSYFILCRVQIIDGLQEKNIRIVNLLIIRAWINSNHKLYDFDSSIK